MRRSTEGFCRALDLVDPYGSNPVREHFPVHRIAVAQQVSGRGVPGERLDDLLGRPLSGGGVGDVDVNHASPVVREGGEDEQDLE